MLVYTYWVLYYLTVYANIKFYCTSLMCGVTFTNILFYFYMHNVKGLETVI